MRKQQGNVYSTNRCLHSQKELPASQRRSPFAPQFNYRVIVKRCCPVIRNTLYNTPTVTERKLSGKSRVWRNWPVAKYIANARIRRLQRLPEQSERELEDFTESFRVWGSSRSFSSGAIKVKIATCPK